MTNTVATKDRIIDAATLLVSEKGYLGATTREIASRAGVTELTLFRHFGSKERLFEALLGRQMFLPRLKEIMPKVDALSYEEGLQVIGEGFLLSLKERKPLIKIMHSEVNHYPDKVRKIYNQLIDATREVLKDYFAGLQKKKVLRAFGPDMAAKAFLGMLFSYFRTEEIMRGVDITRGGRLSRDVRELVDLFVNGTASRNGAKRRHS
ncbi:MAG: TetR/AcrR family transcriptional regulator [Nitrospiraceae bacterium]|nr:TetR/AcrR family transcriptional regulator [Nitrospiraceae bacterium]